MYELCLLSYAYFSLLGNRQTFYDYYREITVSLCCITRVSASITFFSFLNNIPRKHTGLSPTCNTKLTIKLILIICINKEIKKIAFVSSVRRKAYFYTLS